MEISGQLDLMDLVGSSPEGSRARTSVSLDAVQVWQEHVRDCSGRSCGCLTRLKASGSSLKTSPVSSTPNEDGTWESSSGRWQNSGMAWRGECWMLSTSESPNAAAECSLSDVLETQPVERKYFLSARAAEGILTRSSRQGNSLPRILEESLRGVLHAL